MNKMPEKPETMKAQVDMLWDAVFNHIPTKLNWQNIKLNFIMTFIALILALQAVILMAK